LRVEVRPGELTTTSGYSAPRSEVYGPLEPFNVDRWYEWSLLIPEGFTFATDATWLSLTQWKGQRGGPPPIALEVKQNWLRLGGARANAGLVTKQNLGRLTPGVWTRLQVGIRHATDGWVQVFRDGIEVLPRTPLATVDVIGGQPDPVYVKQGIYRDDRWTCPHTIYYGPLTIR
jgi:hypothetical protein